MRPHQTCQVKNDGTEQEWNLKIEGHFVLLNPEMELGMYIYKEDLGQSQITQDNKEMSVKRLGKGHRKGGYRSRKAVYLGRKVETKEKRNLRGVSELRRNFGEEMSNSELGRCCYTTHARRSLSSSL